MRFSRFITAALMLVFVLSGCGVLKLGGKKKTKDKPAPAGKTITLVGIVEMVNPEQRYVLIRCEVAANLPAGTELIALDAGGVQSKLVLTPERKGLYLTADVKEGTPKVKDLVMLRKDAPPQGAATPPMAMPAAPQPAAVMPLLPLPNTTPSPPPAQAAPLPLEPPLPKATAPAPPPP